MKLLLAWRSMVDEVMIKRHRERKNLRCTTSAVFLTIWAISQSCMYVSVVVGSIMRANSYSKSVGS